MNRIWHNSSALEQTLQIYFLVYHELKAHVQWLVSRPAEAVFYKRFQVGECACFFYVSLTCYSHVSLIGVGFIRMLVLTLGGLLPTVMNRAKDRGPFQIILRMMDVNGAELTCASDVGQLDARFLPYHYDLREYVRLAVNVMRVCQG